MIYKPQKRYFRPDLDCCVTEKQNFYARIVNTKNDAEFATQHIANKQYTNTFQLIVRWDTGIDEGNVHVAKHFIQERICYGHVSELDQVAWLIYIVRYTVNEEALGR